MHNKYDSEIIQNLFEAVTKIEDVEECYNFFEDLCTIPEIKEMASRFDVARRLYEKQKYSEISEETGASTATISRVNKCLQYGAGGYENLLKKIEK